MPNYRGAPKAINPHYNRELELLLNGKKKIAVFSTGFFADSDWPDKNFEIATREADLQKLEFIETFRYRRVKYLYFFSSEKTKAVERLRELFQQDIPREELACLETQKEIGTLLGYSEAEIAAWIDYFQIGKARNKLLYPHRGIELELMLKGQKPLARFDEFIDPKRGEATSMRWTDEEFSSFVKQGLFIRKEYFREYKDILGDIAKAHFLYFAPPKEEWRINELMDLDQENYTFSDERSVNYSIREGQLLGYIEQEIEAYINHYYGHLN